MFILAIIAASRGACARTANQDTLTRSPMCYPQNGGARHRALIGLGNFDRNRLDLTSMARFAPSATPIDERFCDVP